MLNEFYILKNTNLYYYFTGENKEINFNDIILSSGLLGALNLFTKSARSEWISSFVTENELFKFKVSKDGRFQFVYVFDVQTYDEKFGKIIIKNIFELINSSKFLESDHKSFNFSNKDSKYLTKAIKNLIDFKLPQQLTDKHLQAILEEEKCIEYGIIKNFPSGIVIATYSKRIAFIRKNFEDELDLIISVVNKTLKNLEISEDWLIISFESNDQQFLIFNMDDYTISLLSSELAKIEYFIDILKKCNFSKNISKNIKIKSAEFSINSKYIRDNNGKILFKEGIKLHPRSSIYLGTLTHNIINFSSHILNRILTGFYVAYISLNNEMSLLEATLKDDFLELTINNN